jgi:hypothetical protein
LSVGFPPDRSFFLNRALAKGFGFLKDPLFTYNPGPLRGAVVLGSSGFSAASPFSRYVNRFTELGRALFHRFSGLFGSKPGLGAGF